MFCYQCQEAAKGTGCTLKGVCGKSSKTSDLQDLLIYTLKGLCAITPEEKKLEVGDFVAEALFTTITNANFDDERFIQTIQKALDLRAEFPIIEGSPKAATWSLAQEQWKDFSTGIGILAEKNEDIRSLKELITYGLKGIAAYQTHAAHLGKKDPSINAFLVNTLADLLEEKSADELVALNLATGESAVRIMALLDSAHTGAYGNPEITHVKLDTGSRPGILVSGHDLADMEMLLEQSKEAGIDVYTHSEMLPTHYYPAFKKYEHLYGNYGNAWWQQDKEFASFQGPILMTTNCIVPVKDSYKNRIFTTGQAGFPGVPHIQVDKDGKKDFSVLIELAKTCPSPEPLEEGTLVGGFGHAQVMAVADQVVEAVQSGAIGRFVVMAGCDGRHSSREYFTEVAKELPQDTVILTAGCAKYRYNKLDLGDIGGIPRVLDAGQCNDSYSLALIALKLKEAFQLEDINDLPISFDLGWYEQKAVAVLLALLHLGVKGIRLGPTLPAFVSPGVAKVLVENFHIKGIGEAASDVAAMLTGG